MSFLHFLEQVSMKHYTCILILIQFYTSSSQNRDLFIYLFILHFFVSPGGGGLFLLSDGVLHLYQVHRGWGQASSLPMMLLVFLNHVGLRNWESGSFPLWSLEAMSCGEYMEAGLKYMHHVKDKKGMIHVHSAAEWAWPWKPADLGCPAQYVKAMPMWPCSQTLEGISMS